MTQTLHETLQSNLFTKLGCQGPLGMESGKISDGQISASSQLLANHAANQGRLHFQATGTLHGAWSADENDAHPWLQVYLACEAFIITRVATQGRNGCCSQWVTKYNLLYGDDKKNFQYYREQGESIKVTNKTPDILEYFLYWHFILRVQLL